MSSSENGRPHVARPSRHRVVAALGAVVAAVVVAAMVVAGVSPAAAAPGAVGRAGAATDATFQTFRSPATGQVGKYHLWASGIDTTKPVGLMLQFHGDGAYEFDNPDSAYSLGGPRGLRNQAERHNMILVALRSPDRGSAVWWRGGQAKADYVRDLLEKVVYARHDIARDRSWLVGYSGGAEFVTRFLLPTHSSLFRGGGAVLFGGGGEPVAGTGSFAPTFAAAFPMYWYTGARDNGTCADSDYNALGDAREGSSYYRAKGFPATLHTPAGVCHDLTGRFGPVTGGRLDLRHPR